MKVSDCFVVNITICLTEHFCHIYLLVCFDFSVKYQMDTLDYYNFLQARTADKYDTNENAFYSLL